MSDLERNAAQMALFDDDRKQASLAEAMDEINNRYGAATLKWGTLAKQVQGNRIISPAWRPTGDRMY